MLAVGVSARAPTADRPIEVTLSPGLRTPPLPVTPAGVADRWRNIGSCQKPPWQTHDRSRRCDESHAMEQETGIGPTDPSAGVLVSPLGSPEPAEDEAANQGKGHLWQDEHHRKDEVHDCGASEGRRWTEGFLEGLEDQVEVRPQLLVRDATHRGNVDCQRCRTEYREA